MGRADVSNNRGGGVPNANNFRCIGICRHESKFTSA
jgi:hypothetical protein